MNIRTALTNILEKMVEEKGKPFKSNELANFIRTDFNSIVKKEINRSDLIIDSSAGAGVWADVFWLSVLDPRITRTTQAGIYPVYLFCSDGSGVYLSLNQGTTELKSSMGSVEAQKKFEEIKIAIHDRYPLTTWITTDLDLKANTTLGKSYQRPNIFAKYYPKASLPAEEVINADLKEILDIYSKIAANWEEISKKTRANTMDRSISKDFEHMFFSSIKKNGLSFSLQLIQRFLSSLASKPFLILTGLSGSGKTKLAEAFALWIIEDDSQFCRAAVGPDWTSREPLLGFPNALKPGEYVMPESGVLQLLLKAQSDLDRPYFLLLDEMNLSHVEKYFADFLSAMESADKTIKLHGMDGIEGMVPKNIVLPPNLFIIGTVNVDETTYMFSPKVLDRAYVIEFRAEKDAMEEFLAAPEAPKMKALKSAGKAFASVFFDLARSNDSPGGEWADRLMAFFTNLQEAGAEFGFRTAYEAAVFCSKYKTLAGGDAGDDDIFDAVVSQKLLPKLHGSQQKLGKVLKELGKLCLKSDADKEFPEAPAESAKYPVSYEKLVRMNRRLQTDGYTSYAEA